MHDSGLRDRLGRPLTDLRVSVTDRCNFRCPYCMPRQAFADESAFLPREQILTFEEIARLVEVFVALGVDKIRITGGEPLLRRDLTVLLSMLRRRHPELELALTTNGVLLGEMVDDLAAAGLDRVTVSLDAIDIDAARRSADAAVDVPAILAAVTRSVAAGLIPVKVNVTLVRGVNDDQIEQLVERLTQPGVVVRFIEFMDVGSSNAWRPDLVVPANEVLDRLGARWRLQPLTATRPGEVAHRYQLDGGGEVGVIASVTQPFCRDCTRARLASNGVLYTCLFAESGIDLRGPVRGGATREELVEMVGATWRRRVDRYSELRGEEATSRKPRQRVEMSRIGG